MMGAVVSVPIHQIVSKEIDVDTKPFRDKYAKRVHGRNLSYPAGGADVHRLCNAVDRLTRLVRDLQAELPTDQQNEVERRLWNI
jgi:hypothetical protein